MTDGFQSFLKSWYTQYFSYYYSQCLSCKAEIKKKIQIFYSTFCWKCINMSSKSRITEKTNYSKKVFKNHSSY